MRAPRVYIAGPYRSDPEYNTQVAMHVASALWALGVIPYVPHLSHYWDKVSPHPEEDWLALGKEWVSSCDAVFRIFGDSPGAEAEVALARDLDLPVFFTYDAVQNWLAERWNKPLPAPKSACDPKAGEIGTNDRGGKSTVLETAMTLVPPQALYAVGRVCKEGAQKYRPGNWRQVGVREHLNHVLEHLNHFLQTLEEGDVRCSPDGKYAFGEVDAQETEMEHLEHAACRMLMALEVAITEQE